MRGGESEVVDPREVVVGVRGHEGIGVGHAVAPHEELGVQVGLFCGLYYGLIVGDSVALDPEDSCSSHRTVNPIVSSAVFNLQ